MTRHLNVALGNGLGPLNEPDNPLLQGIPDPQNNQDLVRLLAHDPFRDPAWRKANCHPSRLLDNLRSVYIPTGKSLKVAQALYSCVRNGYARRDPRHPAVWSSFYHLEGEHPISGIGPIYANGTTISGISGLGKSHVVLRVLSTMPQTIRHSNFSSHLASLTQIVWLYLDMNTGVGMEALLLEILGKIDELLMGETNYVEQNSKSHIGLERIIKNTIRALKTHFCGVIVLDEIQRQNFGLKNASERVRNFLLNLLNTGIAVVLVGNPLGLTFEEKKGQSAQLSRRLQAHAKIRLDPADSYKDEDWKFIVQGLWRCQILPVQAPLDENMQRLLFELTGGFPDFLSALLAASQLLAHQRKLESLDGTVIKDAAHTNSLLQTMKPLIDAFVFKDPIPLQKFSDIDHEYYCNRWIQKRSNVKNAGAATIPEAGLQEEPLNKNSSRSTPHHIVSKGQTAFEADNKRRKLPINGEAPSTLSPLGNFYLQNLNALIEPGAQKQSSGSKDEN
jgi:hypothetical protein